MSVLGIRRLPSIWQKVGQYTVRLRQLASTTRLPRARGSHWTGALVARNPGHRGQIYQETCFHRAGTIKYLRVKTDELPRPRADLQRVVAQAIAICRSGIRNSAAAIRNEPSGALHGIMRIARLHPGRRPHLSAPKMGAGQVTAFHQQAMKGVRRFRLRQYFQWKSCCAPTSVSAATKPGIRRKTSARSPDQRWCRLGRTAGICPTAQRSNITPRSHRTRLAGGHRAVRSG